MTVLLRIPHGKGGTIEISAPAYAAIVWTGSTLEIVFEVHRPARGARRSSMVRLAAVARNVLRAQIAQHCLDSLSCARLLQCCGVRDR
jgi:hypothetical protein